ncbi:DUF547 domain-containing protein [Pelagibius litoralis]|uniref:DUF547 domain-containing protein n=1 Tax=Pelagibius litoralis TaxID=374515 RepID=A0A967CA58_9PROT|nr:DUF547 domain-containing protein [Pelagibius litoralis]NIA67453.1 DUF547 domain-containing protein [Pelagibius litoralis]
MQILTVFLSGLRPLVRLVLPVALVIPLAAFTSAERLFAPSSDLWPRWERHDPGNTAEIDFSAWDGFLKRHVTIDAVGVSRLDYGAVAAQDKDTLARIVEEMAATPISNFARNEQFAFWVNLYNAVTIKVVVDHFPVETIRDIDISPGLFSEGPWDRELVTVEGEALTLNDIEHRILRPVWDDPRIHYAVNCASIGCPNLAQAAFTGSGMETQLDAAARSYINDPRGVSIAGGKVTVSKIYDWFHEDFGGNTKSVLAHLQRYADPALAARLEEIGDIEGTAYDWNLNGVAAVPEG